MIYIIVAVGFGGLVSFYAFFHGVGQQVVKLQVTDYQERLIRFRDHLERDEKQRREQVIETSYRVLR